MTIIFSLLTNQDFVVLLLVSPGFSPMVEEWNGMAG